MDQRVPSWSSTGVSHLRRRNAARGRATQRQEPLVRPAARENMARRAEGWDWTAKPSWARDGRQRHTHTRRRTTMDTDDKLRSIFGNLRGGRLEDVADKLIALFREPDWWEEDFEKQFVARGSIEAFQDAEKCDAVKAFIRTLLTRAQHEERQKLLTDIARLRENVFASAASPEETSGAVKLYDCLLHDLRQNYATPQAKPGN